MQYLKSMSPMGHVKFHFKSVKFFFIQNISKQKFDNREDRQFLKKLRYFFKKAMKSWMSLMGHHTLHLCIYTRTKRKKEQININDFPTIILFHSQNFRLSPH